MTTDTSPAMAPVRDLLAGVRAHLRRSRILRGTSIVIASLGAAYGLSFALDLLLDLPAVVRGIHLAVVAVALILIARWAFRPLAQKPTDAALAEAIEHDVPEFQDRLTSSLDFEKRVADPAEPESRRLMADAIRDAGGIALRIDASLLVDRRPARRAMLLAAAAVASFAAIQVAYPEESATWWRRGVTLSDDPYPRRTMMRVEGFPPQGPLVITRGDDLRVIAVAEGAFPPDADLHLEELADAAEGETPAVSFRDVRKMLPVEGQPGRYSFDFRAVPSSFRFHVTGGDDQDEIPVYEVRAMIPPRVAKFVARVEPPAYSGVAPMDVREPSFDALTGSKVTFEFTSNIPLSAARRVPTQGTARETEALALSPDARTFTWSTVLDATVEFHLELVAVAGHQNRGDDDVFRVGAVTDHPPSIQLLHPHARASVTPNGVIPVKAVVEDDFGLAGASLELVRGGTPVWTPSLWTPPAAPAGTGDGAAPAQPVKKTHVFLMADFAALPGTPSVPARPGDDVSLRLRANDTGSHDTQTPDVTVEIVAPDEMSHRLASEMARLREDLTQARRAQRRTVGGLRDLAGTLASAPADAAGLRRARDLLVDQGRVINDTSRFLTSTFRVFDGHVLNRLGAQTTLDKLLPLYEVLLAGPPGDTGEVFPAALYTRIVDDKRANRLFDPEMLGILMDVMDLGLRARDERGPAAYDSLDRWTADGGAHTGAALGEPQKAAADLLATLDAIDERLQRFEDMEQILRLAKTIREAQDVLSKRLSGDEESR